MSLAHTLTLVLHQTRSPDNLGSVARAMANFDFQRLVLADPSTYAFLGAERLAVKGSGVLEKMRVTRSLPEALTECVYAVGTTSREDLKGRTALTPEEAVAQLVRHSTRGPVALVMGNERRGLSDDELACCQDVLVIPTSDVQPSMNLAQATTVLLYLCSRAERPAALVPDAGEAGARLGTLQVLGRIMEEALLAAEFLNRQAPEHIRRELERSLFRAGLTQREAELWLTAFKHVVRGLPRAPVRAQE